MAKKSTLAPDVELAREVVVELVRTGCLIGAVGEKFVADLRTAADRAPTS
jgi:hypothetical protein